MTKNQANRPLRLGKLRGGGMRPWQTKLYGPTPARPRPRVVYKDLETGEWRYLSGEDMEEANAIFDKAERWLDAGVTLAADTHETDGAKRDIAALGKRLLTRMEDDGVRRRTLQDWERIVRCHIVPVIGARSVVQWDAEDCQKVLRRVRKAGRGAGVGTRRGLGHGRLGERGAPQAQVAAAGGGPDGDRALPGQGPPSGTGGQLRSAE